MSTPSSFAALRAELASGSTTVPARVEYFLERIAQHQQLNAFRAVFAEQARAQAQAVHAKLQAGTAGKLAGVVLAVKDNIVLKDAPAQASSKILDNFHSLFTATGLQRLLDEDAIVIGSTNCDEFAMGSSNENSAFGPVRNPLDPSRVPGGSSGGSAAALAAGLCDAALGTDTGGSVRQPAAFTGLVGLKPTYGRVSRYGLMAFASSFDCLSPFTKTVDDAAELLQLIAGQDPNDNTTSTQAVDNYPAALAAAQKPARIALMRPALESEGLDPAIRKATQDLVDWLTAQGHTIELVDFPYLEYVTPTYYVLTTAEASSNLARYDGIRYGYRNPDAKDLNDLYVLSRSEGFGPEVQRRIVLGTFVLSAGYYDAYYTKAQKVRRLIFDWTEALFQDFDFLLSPTTPTPAFPIGEKTDDPIAMYLNDLFTVHANLAGVPAISLPLAQTPGGLPIGMHLSGPRFSEAGLLAFSHHLMQHYPRP